MALYALGDTHLSLGGNKAMDTFGGPGQAMWKSFGTPLPA